MTEARDKALAARKAERNPMACNPDTEFTLGFDAGVNCSEIPNGFPGLINWSGMYAVMAIRAAQYELVIREAGLSVRDALTREVFTRAEMADGWDAGYAKALTDDGFTLETSGYHNRVNPYRNETKEQDRGI